MVKCQALNFECIKNWLKCVCESQMYRVWLEVYTCLSSSLFLFGILGSMIVEYRENSPPVLCE